MTNLQHADLLALLNIAAGPGGERPVVDFLRSQLIQLGVPPDQIVTDAANTQSEYGGSSGNLIVRIDGHGHGPRRMFSAHMDTVPGAVGAIPRIDGGRIVNDASERALGGDNRTGCAVLLTIARTLLARHGDHAPTTLVFFVQEEVGLVGARGLDVKLLGDPLPTMGFNFDSSSPNELITKVIGTQRFTIQVAGIPSHAGLNPGDGVSAALIAADALHELSATGWAGVISKAEGAGSANVGTLQGGTGSNVVMASLSILAEARSHDRTFRDAIIERWKAAFRQAASARQNRKGQSGSVSFGWGPGYEAFDLPDNSPVVQTALAAARQIGIEARPVSNDGGMDANWIVAHGIPCLTIGAGQRRVHTFEEHIDLADFDQACRMAIALATI